VENARNQWRRAPGEREASCAAAKSVRSPDRARAAISRIEVGFEANHRRCAPSQMALGLHRCDDRVTTMPRNWLFAARAALLQRRLRLWQIYEGHCRASRRLHKTRAPDPLDRAAAYGEADALDALSETELCEIARIQAALHRIDDGTYGRCIGCADDIEPARLEAVPWTARCGRCADEHELAGVAEAGAPTPQR
jgi:DnaK suppressor protein